MGVAPEVNTIAGRRFLVYSLMSGLSRRVRLRWRKRPPLKVHVEIAEQISPAAHDTVNFRLMREQPRQQRHGNPGARQ